MLILHPWVPAAAHRVVVLLLPFGALRILFSSSVHLPTFICTLSLHDCLTRLLFQALPSRLPSSQDTPRLDRPPDALIRPCELSI